MNDHDKWIFTRLPMQNARMRLFCFSYAGGGSSIYYNWQERMDVVEVASVRLPGREKRVREKPYTDMEKLVCDFIQILGLYFDKPFAFYGHSMGGLISYELARQLQKRGMPTPIHLFVASTYAPHVAGSKHSFHSDPDAQFLQKVKAYGGINQQMLNDNELVCFMLPILRSDFELIASYECKAKDKLNIPITALGGLTDKIITPNELVKWGEYSAFDLEIKLFDGGHFFFEASSEKLLNFINRRLI